MHDIKGLTHLHCSDSLSFHRIKSIYMVIQCVNSQGIGDGEQNTYLYINLWLPTKSLKSTSSHHRISFLKFWFFCKNRGSATKPVFLDTFNLPNSHLSHTHQLHNGTDYLVLSAKTHVACAPSSSTSNSSCARDQE